MEMKFYICKHCGNIAVKIKDSGVPLVCCGEKMPELVANTGDGAVEKHVPVIARVGNTVTVTVGSVNHPMLPEHHIEWIMFCTNKGNQRKVLNAGDLPVATFEVANDEEVIAAFEYCNLHGLYKA